MAAIGLLPWTLRTPPTGSRCALVPLRRYRWALLSAAVAQERPSTCPATQFPLFTLLVIDEHGNGIPVGFVITNNERAGTIAAWLKELIAAARQVMPDFAPSCIIMDDCQAEINAVR